MDMDGQPVQAVGMFHHRRLQSSRSIRVLHLAPAVDLADTIVVELEEVSVDDNDLQYDALSYVWGVTTRTRPILCNTETLLVTPNCESALRQLRLTEKTRTLWIDAICIDQDDAPGSLKEREAQIMLMGEVFSKAHQTLCWFGSGTSTTARAVEYLQQLGKKCVNFGEEENMDDEIDRYFTLQDEILQEGLLGENDSFLDSVLCYPWHLRIWTIQETAFSRQCYIACGSSQIDWISYVAAIAYLAFSSEAPILSMSARLVCITVMTREHFRRAVATNAVSTIKPDDLTSCLAQILGHFSSDPRDKIYGLHALLKIQGVILPDPDYGKAPQTVYEEATKAFILSTGCLDVLRIATKVSVYETLPSEIFPKDWPDTARSTPSLPSWVPDWQNDTRVDVISSTFTKRSIMSNKDPEFIFPEPGHLRLKVVVVGSIVSTHAGNSISPNDLAELKSLSVSAENRHDDFNEATWDTILTLAQQALALLLWKAVLQEKRSLSTDSVVQPSTLDILINMLERDTQAPHDPSNLELVAAVLNYPSPTADLDFSAAKARAEKWREMASSDWNENVFTSVIIAEFVAGDMIGRRRGEVGRLGNTFIRLSNNQELRKLLFVESCMNSGPQSIAGASLFEVQSEDVIILAEGAEFPLAIRKNGEHWTYVGNAYVLGLMNEDAWPDDGPFEEIILI